MGALRNLRVVGFLEGLSFLVLLLVAMPLKYFFGLPIAVRVAGSVHGALFLLFVYALFRVAIARGWPVRRWLLAFGASLVPCGPFVLDRTLKRELESDTLVTSHPSR
jgi:integral membrane protein